MLKELILEALDNASENGYAHNLHAENLRILALEMVSYGLFDEYLNEEVFKILEEIKND